MTIRPRSMRVIATVILLTIVSIALVVFPLSHHASAHQAYTGSMAYNCDDQPSQQAEGYTYWPCEPIGIGSQCLNIHSSPHVHTPVVKCAYTSEAAQGVFSVICQITGDQVAGFDNIWDRLIAPYGAATAYVSDYYIDTTNLGTFSYT